MMSTTNLYMPAGVRVERQVSQGVDVSLTFGYEPWLQTLVDEAVENNRVPKLSKVKLDGDVFVSTVSAGKLMLKEFIWEKGGTPEDYERITGEKLGTAE